MNQFVERYKQMGEKIKPVVIRPSIRINPIRADDGVVSRLESKGMKLTKIPFAKHGYYVKSRFSVGASSEYLLGHYHVQEAASQLPAELLDNKGVVLDACAAPGGKTSQLALNAKVVVALESQHKRALALCNNLERLGVKNCIVYNADARMFEGRFNAALVDAPCSGNYTQSVKWLEKQTLENIEARAELQKEILAAVVGNLKSGGEMVYSTCSLEPEEDELVVQHAIEKLGMKLVEINCIGDEGLTSVFGKELHRSMKYCRRLWPHKTGTEGFFIAKMVKR